MRHNFQMIVGGAAYIAAALLFVKCAPPHMAGTATETENVVGQLYQPDGKTPAAGVCVVMRPKRMLADVSGIGSVPEINKIDSVVTNDTGRFAFDTSVNLGTYVIEATSGSNAVLIDSVVIASKDSTVYLPPDTLKPAGAIKGVIWLSEGGDPQEVYVLAFGTDRFVQPKTDGSFLFSDLAEGNYNLRFVPAIKGYGIFDTINVRVKSADTAFLDTIQAPLTGIPALRNVILSYDTLKQTVTLRWSRPDTAIVKSYNIYRRDIDLNAEFSLPFNKKMLVDTFFIDSTAMQDRTYEYCVAAVDENASEGERSGGLKATIASYFVLDTTFYVDGEGPGLFSNIGDAAVSKKGELYISDRGYDRIQVLDTAMHFKKMFGKISPEKICIDEKGYIIICDDKNIFILDSTEAAVNTIRIPGMYGLIDLDAKDGLFYMIIPLDYSHEGDSIFIYSYEGQRKRAWKCSEPPYSQCIVKGGSNRIYVGSNSKIAVYDTLGNKTCEISLPGAPIQMAFDETHQRLYIGYWFSSPQYCSRLYVIDKNNIEIANYYIDESCQFSLVLQNNGAVYSMTLSGKIYKLNPLPW